MLHLSWSTDEGVKTTMQQLALEALRLAGCRLVMNPAEHLSLIAGRMNHGHEAQHSLDHAFYVNLLVKRCSTIKFGDANTLHADDWVGCCISIAYPDETHHNR